MKPIFSNMLRGAGLFAAVLLGGIPLLVGVAGGLLCRSSRLAYVTSIVITLSVTILSWNHPGLFRFRAVDLNLHRAITIGGSPPLLLNLAYNLGLTVLGVVAALAARKGYVDARGESPGGPETSSGR